MQEMTYVFINRCMDKQTMVYSYNIIAHINKKEKLNTCMNLKNIKLGKKKSDIKGYTLQDSIYMKF